MTEGTDQFQGVANRRAGYDADPTARVIDWLRKYPHATLASGEGALLLAEIDRLRAIVADVSIIHGTETGRCAACGWDAPCPTLRAVREELHHD